MRTSSLVNGLLGDRNSPSRRSAWARRSSGGAIATRCMEMCKPIPGAAVTVAGKFVGTVTEVSGSICWMRLLDGSATTFIWMLRDGLNDLHNWPNKDESLTCKNLNQRRTTP